MTSEADQSDSGIESPDANGRGVKIFKVNTRIALVASSEPQAQEQFHELRAWLGRLSNRSHRGTRFLYGVGATVGEADSYLAREAEIHADGVAMWEVATSFQLVADDRTQALERFQRYTEWLGALKSRGHQALRFVDCSTMGQGCSIAAEVEYIVDPGHLELFPLWNAWLDPSDRGEMTEQDVEEVFRWDSNDRLILRTDERVEAVEALQLVADLLPRVEDETYVWKWVVIALHNAVQAYMVLALQGTWPVRVLMNDDARTLMEANRQELAGGLGSHERDWRIGEGKLDRFLNLYNKIKNDRFMGQLTISRTFHPTQAQTVNAKRLNRLRNDFIHFTPKILVEYVDGYPEMVTECISIISFLCFDSHNIHWGSEQQYEHRTRRLLRSISQEAERLTTIYATA